MNRTIFISTIMFVLAVVFMKYNIIETMRDFLHQDHSLLVIGVASSRQNFHMRQQIRQTWRNFITKPEMQYFFLIGQNDCKIPPDDREDEYSCKEWPMSLEGVVDDKTELTTSSFYCGAEALQAPLYLGFNFIVHHPIVVKKLGVWCPLLVHLKRVKVSLKHVVSAERATSATFLAEDCLSPVVSKTVEALLLPRGYEGQVVVEIGDWPLLLNISCQSRWSDTVGAIRILQLIQRLEERPHGFQKDFFMPVTMTYTIHDIDRLKNHLETKAHRVESWHQTTASTESRLLREQEENGDIVFLNLVDVYRNLPSKVLQFMEWAYSNKKFSYLLKTDDDSFIDIPAIVSELRKVEAENGDDLCRAWWWSSFREGWPVHTAGKWREDNYRSLTYPPFPCGAGYVLSYRTVKFLATNAADLYTGFQGEDVSMGIWLAGLNPCRHRGSNVTCVWSCDEERHPLACNRAQLSEQALLQTWRDRIS